MKNLIPLAVMVDDIADALSRVIGNGIAELHEPVFEGNEIRYLKQCIDTGYVSSVGNFVNQFECELANFTGASHAVALVNGTAALHLALKILGVEHGDEVLIPALSFVATANAVSHCGAQPIFIDSEPTTFGIDAVKLKLFLEANTNNRDGQCINKNTGKKIKGIIAMHVFGNPCDVDSLAVLARDFNIFLLEDAAEGVGSFLNGVHVGLKGAMGILSFNGNKTITTGGGGAIITNNSELAARAKHLSTTAKVPHPWEFCHDQVAFNYRMPNLNAAVGCAQLEELPKILKLKRVLHEKYRESFKSVDGVNLIGEPLNTIGNHWLNILRLDEKFIDYRDLILDGLNNRGYRVRPVWRLLSSLEPYKHCERVDLQVARGLEKSLINIPSGAGLLKR